MHEFEPTAIDAGLSQSLAAPVFDPANDLAAQLATLQSRYRGLIDHLPAVIYIDAIADGEPMIDVGPGVEELLGISRSDFLSSPLVWTKAIHPEDRERVTAASEHSVATGDAFRLEYRALHPDGAVKWIREESQLVHDGAGDGPLLARDHA